MTTLFHVPQVPVLNRKRYGRRGMDNGYCQTQKETCDGRGEACRGHPTVADPVHCVLGVDIHGRRRRVFGQKMYVGGVFGFGRRRSWF